MTGGRQLRTQVAVAAIVLVPALAAPVSARTETVRFAVTDMEGLEQLQQAFGAFETELEKVTGLAMELFPASSRTAAVEAMRAEQVDFVMTWPAEYGIMKELLDRRIVVAWQRPDYFSQIVALATARSRRSRTCAARRSPSAPSGRHRSISARHRRWPTSASRPAPTTRRRSAASP